MTESSAATLPALEQSDCTNCGVSLSGKFCHSCGQSSRSMIKFFGEVLKELLDDILGYDSRLKHSVLPLLFKPGKLTLEYIHGKRFYYVMPFRLYLITSIIFIFVIQLNLDPDILKITDEDTIEISAADKQELKTDVTQIMDDIGDSLSEQQKQLLLQKVENIGVAEKPKSITIPEEIDTSNPIKEPSFEETAKDECDFGFTFIDGKPVYRPCIIEEEGPLKVFADEINKKAPNWLENPIPLIEELFRIAPYMMLFLIPIFALFQKLFYAFSKRYYIEHLIFSLHNHSFLYIALMASIATESTTLYLSSMPGVFAQTGYYFFSFLDLLIAIWIVAYLFLATKKVYQQGWIMTVSKVFILGLIYFILSMLGMAATIVVGAYIA